MLIVAGIDYTFVAICDVGSGPSTVACGPIRLEALLP